MTVTASDEKLIKVFSPFPCKASPRLQWNKKHTADKPIIKNGNGVEITTIWINEEDNEEENQNDKRGFRI